MTPEPKEGTATSVTSAQEAAVDAMAAALRFDLEQRDSALRAIFMPTPETIAFWQATPRDAARVMLDALLSPTKKPCAEPTCRGDGLDHTNDHGETPCPSAPADDPMHSESWYDGEDCYRCGDPGLGPCPGGCTDGFVLSPPPIEGLGWVKVSET